MASELYVETLKGLTSGANANKVIIPSGQTLVAPSVPVNYEIIESTQTQQSISTTSLGLVDTITYTPILTSSTVYIDVMSLITHDANTVAEGRGEIEFRINGTAVYNASEVGTYDRGGSGVFMNHSFTNYLSYTNTDGSNVVLTIYLAVINTSRATQYNHNNSKSRYKFIEVGS